MSPATVDGLDLDDLVSEWSLALRGRQAGGISRFVSSVLGYAWQHGSVHAGLNADRTGIVIDLPGGQAYTFVLPHARSVLRMACARLGVVSRTAGGGAVDLFGGEGYVPAEFVLGGDLRFAVHPYVEGRTPGEDCGRFRVTFSNDNFRPVEFTVVPLPN